ncbi:MAG: NAD-dependent epimerase/dehydratase family protein [Woeseiaceae bacterium]
MGNRRNFIKAGLLGGALAASGLPGFARAKSFVVNSKPLDILVLGGTGFIGPHMVREALRRGHAVTLFNRGRTNVALFPDLETIKGDRDNGLDGLKGRQWDAVIDNSGYVPRHVADSARLLSPNVGFYLYISTIAVYADFTVSNDEDSALATIDDESIEEVTGETYGPLKALCEKRVGSEIASDRLSIVRPTFICGPGDHTDRFTYYPARTKKGGTMAWPGSPQHEMQVVDVRDLASFVVDSVVDGISGTFNAVSPPGTYNFGDLLDDSQAVTGAAVESVWLDDAFIAANEARGSFPIYFPAHGLE